MPRTSTTGACAERDRCLLFGPARLDAQRVALKVQSTSSALWLPPDRARSCHGAPRSYDPVSGDEPRNKTTLEHYDAAVAGVRFELAAASSMSEDMTGSTESAKSEGFRAYRKKGGLEVTAVRLALDFEGFEYRKWGSVQRAKKGDWLLDNRGDIYTVDAETFAATYAEASPGRFVKQATVWAKEAQEAGAILTKEGTTEYEAGDFLVFNEADLDDGYAVARDEFLAMYDRAE